LLNDAAAGPASSGNNGRLMDADDGNQQQKPIANVLANDSAVKMPLPTTVPGGYMTLPLNKSSAVSGNRQPPAIDQGHFLRRVTTTGTQLLPAPGLSSNSPIITRNSSAHCRGTTTTNNNNNTTTVHLLNSSSFNFWCLAI
jgi:hypothetical protein